MRAFTVPEMLAIVAIVVILLALLMPSLRRARESTRRAICISNQRQISIGSFSYSVDHLGVLPVYHTWAMHYVSDSNSNDQRAFLLDVVGRGASGTPDVFYCPSHDALNAHHAVGWYGLGAGRFISYGPIGIWQQSVTTMTSWPKTYTQVPVNSSPTVEHQGNRAIKRHQATADLALITDSQIAWYAGSWGISFTYPGDGIWPDDPGYYAYYAYPHREPNGAWAGSNAVYFDGSGEWGNFADIVNLNAPYPHGAKWILHYQRGIYEGPVFW